MAIEVSCPNGHVLKVKDELAGRSGLCPHCRARVRVPQPRRVTDDDVLAILAPPKAVAATAPAPLVTATVTDHDSEFVHQDSRLAAAAEADETAISPAGSSVLRRKKVCPKCCNVVSLSFRSCPRCGTPLAACTVENAAAERTAPPLADDLPGLKFARHGAVIVARFTERQLLEPSLVDDVSRQLHRVAKRPDCRHLAINFAEVSVLSSSLLTTLLALKHKLEAKKGRLMLCCVGGDIRQVFSTTRLGQLFDIWNREEDALAAF